MGPFKGLRQEDEDTAIAVLFSDFYQTDTYDDENKDLEIAVMFNEFHQINPDDADGEDFAAAFNLNEFCQAAEETESSLIDVKFDELNQMSEEKKIDKPEKKDKKAEKGVKEKRNKKEKKVKKNNKNKKSNATEEDDSDEDPATTIGFNEVKADEKILEQTGKAEKTDEVVWERTEDGIWIKKETKDKNEKKKKSKCAFSNYNENGQINTKAFNKSEGSKGFWASFFEGFLAFFGEITGFGPGVKSLNEDKKLK